MIYKIIKLTIIAFCCVFFSCEKKEMPAPSYNRGDVLTVQIEMTSNYNNQVWYRLSDNKVVSTNLKTDWDLGFESSSNGFHIILNSAKSMRAYESTHEILSQITDTIGLGANGIADMASGNLDSTAFGNWQVNNNVFIINRGYDEIGQLIGFYKLKIIMATPNQCTFEYGDIYSNVTFTGTVNKNIDYNFSTFSFNNHHQVNIEPKKTDYDLCFTQFTHVFTNPFQYYQVSGVLNNNYKTRILKIKDKTFKNLTLNDTIGKVFSGANNVIGYNWKTFSIANNLFTIEPNVCFIINDSKGFFYKLQFIDFYNSSGIKGYPKFEFKKL